LNAHHSNRADECFDVVCRLEIQFEHDFTSAFGVTRTTTAGAAANIISKINSIVKYQRQV
jgi:hypothetical protein